MDYLMGYLMDLQKDCHLDLSLGCLKVTSLVMKTEKN
jgi:hypothetical protein